MRNILTKREKLDNRGMSLVEVLVAMVILAIATGPVLSAFVSAIRYNSSAKAVQQETTALQSVMEGFKAYDVEELCLQFNNASTNGFSVISTGGVDSFRELAISDRDGDGTADVSVSAGEFTAALDNKYAFVMAGVTFDNNTKYDVLAELEPYMASADPGVITSENIFDYSMPKTNTTALYTQAIQSMDWNVEQSLRESSFKDAWYNKLGVSSWLSTYAGIEYPDQIADLMIGQVAITEKKNEIKVENAADGKVAVRVYISYKVKVPQGTYLYTDASGNTVSGNVPESSHDVYLVADAGAENGYRVSFTQDSYTAEIYLDSGLSDVYYYYYPVYGNGVSESFYVDNRKIVPGLTVYLVKQAGGGFSQEENYRTRVSVYNNDALCSSSSWPNSVSQDGVLCTTVRGNVFRNTAGSTGAGTADLTETENEILVYSVRLTIYEDGSAANDCVYEDGHLIFESCTPLRTMDGTMND